MDTFDKILTAIIGLAIVAVIVSQKAQSSQIIQSIAQSLGAVVGTATAPVTGATSAANANPVNSALTSDNINALATLVNSAQSGSLGTGANASDIVNQLQSLATGQA